MQHQSPSSDVIIDVMLTFNLSQIIKQPTRIQGLSSNILDLVFVSDHFPTDRAVVELIDGIPDHRVVSCSIPVHDRIKSSRTVSTFLDFNKVDDTSILDHLSHEFSSFEQLSRYPGVHIESLRQKFKEVVSHCILYYVPTKTKKENKANPWINRDIIHAKRKVKRLRISCK